MSRKGFTLVELLTVIAILAILVIITLPNVMTLFNEAKMNSFLNECKQIYKSSEQQWMRDSIFSTGDQEYSRCNDCSGKSLKLSGRQQIDYYVKLNKSGKVIVMYVTDGSYQYSYEGNGLLITDITSAEQIASLPENRIITISSSGYESGDSYYLYSSRNEFNFSVGMDVSTLNMSLFTNNLSELLSYHINYFARGKVVNNKINQMEMAFIYNNNPIYLKIDNTYSYENAKQILMNTLPSSYCNIIYNYDIENYKCVIPANGDYEEIIIEARHEDFAIGSSNYGCNGNIYSNRILCGPYQY